MILTNSLIHTIERLTGLRDLSDRNLELYYNDYCDMFQWSTVKLDPIEYTKIKRCSKKVRELGSEKITEIITIAEKVRKYNEESELWVK
jgi:hypothetical protein|tara:strand:+ start:826 stop:1092 length:267 start_codon:yes stop_codon:yes gene_type:complete